MLPMWLALLLQATWSGMGGETRKFALEQRHTDKGRRGQGSPQTPWPVLPLGAWSLPGRCPLKIPLSVTADGSEEVPCTALSRFPVRHQLWTPEPPCPHKLQATRLSCLPHAGGRRRGACAQPHHPRWPQPGDRASPPQMLLLSPPCPVPEALVWLSPPPPTPCISTPATLHLASSLIVPAVVWGIFFIK